MSAVDGSSGSGFDYQVCPVFWERRLTPTMSSFPELQKLAGILPATVNVPAVVFNTCFYSQSFDITLEGWKNGTNRIFLFWSFAKQTWI
jgi:hypothetical protein